MDWIRPASTAPDSVNTKRLRSFFDRVREWGPTDEVYQSPDWRPRAPRPESVFPTKDGQASDFMSREEVVAPLFEMRDGKLFASDEVWKMPKEDQKALLDAYLKQRPQEQSGIDAWSKRGTRTARPSMAARSSDSPRPMGAPAPAPVQAPAITAHPGTPQRTSEWSFTPEFSTAQSSSTRFGKETIRPKYPDPFPPKNPEDWNLEFPSVPMRKTVGSLREDVTARPDYDYRSRFDKAAGLGVELAPFAIATGAGAARAGARVAASRLAKDAAKRPQRIATRLDAAARRARFAQTEKAVEDAAHARPMDPWLRDPDGWWQRWGTVEEPAKWR